jgi:hypothetical protein
MAAPSLNIVKLAESDRTVLLRANISEGGDADLSNLVLADISDYAESVGPAAVALSINRVWWSLENMNIELKFEADTPIKALTLSGNGSYDFETIYGIKNPGGSGTTGSILLDTYGIAINSASGCVGSLIIELWKVRTGETGGELDAAATSSLFTPEVPEVSGGIVIGGNSTASGYIKLLEDSDNGNNWIIVQAPAALAGNVTLTLPNTDGSADQILRTDGSGVLSWVDNTAGGAITPATALQGSSLKLYEITENGENYVELKAPDALGGDVVLTLPATDGDASQVLTTNGSGVLSWTTPVTSDSHFTAATTTVGEKVSLAEGTNNGTNKLILTANANMAADVTLVFPADDGDADQFLKTNGSGVLSWAATTGGIAYETGTFTPIFKEGSSTVTATYGLNTGTYTKVGDLVFVNINIYTTAVSGVSTGVLYIAGLPITPKAEATAFAVSQVQDWAGEEPSSALYYTADKILLMYRAAVDGNDIQSKANDLGTGNAQNYITVSGFYKI